MRDLAVLLVHLIVTIARLLGRGGARSVVAESLLLKHQLLILNRSRERAPNLRPIDRVIAGVCAQLIRTTRLLRSAIVLRPSTIMAFHRALVNRKYRLHDPLFEFHRWKANLRILNLTEINTVPDAPLSHPFIERLAAPYGENSWIKSRFGAPEISNGSCCTSGTTTTEIEFMRRWAAPRPPAKPLISVAG